MFLFKVEAHFIITGRGLTLCSCPKEKRITTGNILQIIRPDKSVIVAKVRGVSFHEPHCILVDVNLTKDDVPVGSEVWINE